MDRVRLVLVILLPLACGDISSDIGKPCDRHSDCASGLECDVHDGQGTCQKPHDDTGDEEYLTSTGHEHGSEGHDSEHDTGATSSSSSSATEGTGEETQGTSGR